MKKNVLIVAQFTQLPNEDGNNRGRFKLIAEMLSNQGYNVTVVTSSFRELDRTFRTVDPERYNENYNIEILREIGYYKNISFRRIFSMLSFSNSLRKYLSKTSKNFDLVYCCVPGLDSTYIAAKYSKKRNIPYIIDVQDPWPEVMYDLYLDIPIVSQIIFSPLQYLANYIYRNADGIMAVSETYMNIALKKAKKCKVNDFVFIGTDVEAVTNMHTSMEKNTEEFWLSYIGSLGHSYDLETLIEAVSNLIIRGYKVKLNIIGEGPLKDDLINFSRKKEIEVNFTGWLNYSEMTNYLESTDAVVNAIKRNAQQSITNKVGDYLKSGKPMLNGSLNVELNELMDSFNFGVNYEPENVASLESAIIGLIEMDVTERTKLGDNAFRLAKELFDRKNTYTRIVDMVGNLIGAENE